MSAFRKCLEADEERNGLVYYGGDQCSPQRGLAWHDSRQEKRRHGDKDFIRSLVLLLTVSERDFDRLA